MSWEEEYKSIPIPESNPCDSCERAVSCKEICPARARWWDRQIRGERPDARNAHHIARGHSKTESGFVRLYTVTDTRTGKNIITKGTSAECAKVMGMAKTSFYRAVTYNNSGRPNYRWKIECTYADEAEGC